jgi:hypothetical protein
MRNADEKLGNEYKAAQAVVLCFTFMGDMT